MSQDQLPDSPPGVHAVDLNSNCKPISSTCNKENVVETEHKGNRTQHFIRSSAFSKVPESKLGLKKGQTNGGKGLENLKSSSNSSVNVLEGTHNTRQEEYEKFVEENQSSEESFDGIRWRASPQELRGRKETFTSSPLKGYCSKPRHLDNKNNSSMLVDEHANSVLSKYGSNFQNIFPRSPIIERAHSDMHIEERGSRKHVSQESNKRSPPHKRSRSVGITCTDSKDRRNLTSKLESSSCRNTNKRALTTSALNSWIDKFEVEGCAKDRNLVRQNLLSQPVVEKSNNATVEYSTLTKEPEIDSLLKDVDFSDDFSDSALLPEGVTKERVSSDAEDPFLSDEDLNLNSFADAIQFANVTGSQHDNFESDANRNLASRNRGYQKWSNSMTELERKEIESFSTESTPTYLSYSKKYFNRFKIKNILKKTYKKENRDREQFILTVQNDRAEETKLIVRGEYLQLDFKKNDIVHVIITNCDNQQLIDDYNNLLIWNPDVLVSATTISQQLSCARKSVLLDRYKFPNETSKPLLVGIILHEVFQSCFLQCNWNADYMKHLLDTHIEERKLEIFSIGDIILEIKAEVARQLPYLETWFRKYYGRTDSVSGTLAKAYPVQLNVKRALEVEDNVWSPTFGIKGKIDVVFDGQITNGRSLDTDILPLELKTGKEHISHLAQSSLYSLLLKDKYDVDVFMFLLVYTKEKIARAYDISSTDLKSLINLRNRITKYLIGGSRELPQTINQTQCDTCLVRDGCVTIHKITNDQRSDVLPMNIYKSLTSHLDGQSHYSSFYNYWDTLITKEESVSTALKKYLWLHSSAEREKLDGKSVGGLVVKESNDSTEGYIYTLERYRDLYFCSLQDSALTKHDKVILSDESGHFALAQGFIINIRPSFMTIVLDKKIDKKFRIDRLKDSSKTCLVKTTFRVDKDDMFHGMGLARFNILNLFMINGDYLRRELVVDLRKPRFLDGPKTKLLGSNLNNSQTSAIQKILKAEDYCLVLGMPGTGKTTVIAELIRHLVQLGRTILITSYTHSALDNILLKLISHQIDILRIGSPSRVHKDIQRFIPGWDGGKTIMTYEDYCSVYLKPMVVATTCLGVNDVAFNLRSHFDYCIIDEASQITLPVSLGPLRFCDKFVLVGDHYQLPPLVQHPDSYVKDGLSQSLFKVLGDAHPDSVVELDLQYRMCEQIMMLSNSLIYNGRLKCGSAIVAKQSLHIPHPDAIQQYVKVGRNSEDLWMNTIFCPQNKVIFLNHDLLPGRERLVGQKIENITESNLIQKIANGLVSSGVQENQIGVMSLYRSQIRLLHRKLQHLPGIEILTADQFQGRDKDCVLISLVRSNEEKKVGDLLKEWRRINVAMTRSKTKLIILGSESTIREENLLNSFTSLIQEKGWIYNLKPNCMDVYEFNDCRENASKKNIEREKGNYEIVKKNPLLRDILNGSK